MKIIDTLLLIIISILLTFIVLSNLQTLTKANDLIVVNGNFLVPTYVQGVCKQ